MKADPRFMGMHSDFWANVRTVGERCQFVNRATKNRPRSIKTYSIADMQKAMTKSGLKSDHLVDPQTNEPTPLATQLLAYFEHRRDVLVSHVRPNLMCAKCAERTFEALKSQLGSTKPVPMNKQSGNKKKPAYLTGIVNMIVEAEVGGRPYNDNPGGLTTFNHEGAPLKTLSRRHDGGFPSFNNPKAIWEVKEYYYTTTFGSKISDGVYITQLDGLEIEEARKVGVDVQLVLMIDAYFTWWVKGGIPYLCRLIDLLHMGYVDEILFGAEVVQRLPEIVRTWVSYYDANLQVPSPPASGAIPPSITTETQS